MIKGKIIVFDLDGTLANTEECRHLLEGKDKKWDEFYLAATQVSAIEPTVEILRVMSCLHRIYVVSGRSDSVRAETLEWFKRHGVMNIDVLLMRKHGDHTPDNELKKSWVESGLIPKDQIMCVFEDRDRLVKMWRSIGVICYQVAEGNF